MKLPQLSVFKFSGGIIISMFFFFADNNFCSAQNIGINTTGAAANSSAGLDVDFTNKGALIPRVSLTSLADVATIASPANYLTVYNTNGAIGNGTGMYYWNGSGWVYMAAPSNGPGSSGQVITSQGTGANPQWITPSTNSNATPGDWTLVAVGNTVWATTGLTSTGYTLTVNKQVLFVLESFLSVEVTLTMADAVSVFQIKNSGGTTNCYVTAPAPMGALGPLPSNNGGPGDYSDYIQVEGKHNGTSAAVKYTVLSLADAVNDALEIDGTGLVWLNDNSINRDVGVYIFER